MTTGGEPGWGQPDGQQPPAGQPNGQPSAPYGQHSAPYGQQNGQQYGQTFPPYGQPYAQLQPPIPVGPDGTPPLWAPWYGIGFLDAATRFFKKYARFDGRASRSEFWFWALANGLVNLVFLGAYLVALFSWIAANTSTDAYGVARSDAVGPPVVALLIGGVWGLWWLATIVPSLALGWRRVHDANLAGPFWLIALFVGIAGIVFGALESNPAGAQYDRPDLG
ncbi:MULTISPECIES: DUF805 domain-containing protein [unclassified Curtobacterium]|uniref:DUF805 domain-containing protein n=1 Tax=unclassified Curtobacterium TaxID=257496 RepID=UPI0021C4EF42|nr:DUF805 domain-containing protein [Curtobacterium sp. C2H10]MCT9622211.1 DUF805 domain-containing protein [Curtobacterium sp. C2H10]